MTDIETTAIKTAIEDALLELERAWTVAGRLHAAVAADALREADLEGWMPIDNIVSAPEGYLWTPDIDKDHGGRAFEGTVSHGKGYSPHARGVTFTHWRPEFQGPQS